MRQSIEIRVHRRIRLPQYHEEYISFCGDERITLVRLVSLRLYCTCMMCWIIFSWRAREPTLERIPLQDCQVCHERKLSIHEQLSRIKDHNI